jgi:hypothetical protein
VTSFFLKLGLTALLLGFFTLPDWGPRGSLAWKTGTLAFGVVLLTILVSLIGAIWTGIP